MKDIKCYYVVSYAYDVDDDNYMCIERYAFIGIFSSMEKANNAISILINQPGFKDHPIECFCIDHYKRLNEIQEWSSGFVKL